MSPEVFPVVSQTSKRDDLSGEAVANPTSEIVDFLTRQLLLNRRPIKQSVFGRDHQMYKLVGQYEKVLATFLVTEPRVLSIGDDLMKREIWLEVISQSYQQEIDRLDQQDLDFQIQREEAVDNLQSLNARIAGIGSERFRSGDIGLLVGRVQVRLYDLKGRGRLNILGRLAARLIGSRPVHPQVEPIQKQLTEAERKAKELEEERRSLAAEHFKKESEQKHHLDRGQEKLFHELDTWAAGSSERFLVHYLYYQRPDLERYLRSQVMSDGEHQTFINLLINHGLVQKENRQKTPDKHLGAKISGRYSAEIAAVSTELPFPIIIGTRIFTKTDSIQAELQKLNPHLSKNSLNQACSRLIQALILESQGSHHPASKQFLASDSISKRVGGKWRLDVGAKHRLIGNFLELDDGQRVLEIVRLLDHDDPKYY